MSQITIPLEDQVQQISRRTAHSQTWNSPKTATKTQTSLTATKTTTSTRVEHLTKRVRTELVEVHDMVDQVKKEFLERDEIKRILHKNLQEKKAQLADLIRQTTEHGANLLLYEHKRNSLEEAFFAFNEELATILDKEYPFVNNRIRELGNIWGQILNEIEIFENVVREIEDEKLDICSKIEKSKEVFKNQIEDVMLYEDKESSLVDAVERLRDKCISLRVYCKDQSRNFSVKTDVLNSLKEELETLQYDIDKLSIAYYKLTFHAHIDELFDGSLIENLNATIHNFETETRENESMAASESNKLSCMKLEESSLVSEIEQAKSEQERLEQEILLVEDRISALERDKAACEERNKGLAFTMSTLSEKLRESLDELNAKKQEVEQTEKELSDKLADMRTDYETMCSLNRQEYDARLLYLQLDLKLKMESDATATQVQTLQDAVTSLARTLEVEVNQLRSEENQVLAMASSEALKKSELETLHVQILEMEEKSTSLVKELRDLEARLQDHETLKEETSMLQASVDEVEAAVSNQKLAIDEKKVELETLESILSNSPTADTLLERALKSSEYELSLQEAERRVEERVIKCLMEPHNHQISILKDQLQELQSGISSRLPIMKESRERELYAIRRQIEAERANLKALEEEASSRQTATAKHRKELSSPPTIQSNGKILQNSTESSNKKEKSQSINETKDKSKQPGKFTRTKKLDKVVEEISSKDLSSGNGGESSNSRKKHFQQGNAVLSQKKEEILPDKMHHRRMESIVGPEQELSPANKSGALELDSSARKIAQPFNGRTFVNDSDTHSISGSIADSLFEDDDDHIPVKKNTDDLPTHKTETAAPKNKYSKQLLERKEMSTTFRDPHGSPKPVITHIPSERAPPAQTYVNKKQVIAPAADSALSRLHSNAPSTVSRIQSNVEPLKRHPTFSERAVFSSSDNSKLFKRTASAQPVPKKVSSDTSRVPENKNKPSSSSVTSSKKKDLSPGDWFFDEEF